jgi:hypothetical protein
MTGKSYIASPAPSVSPPRIRTKISVMAGKEFVVGYERAGGSEAVLDEVEGHVRLIAGYGDARFRGRRLTLRAEDGKTREVDCGN